jgi:hypothetical protein
MQALVHDEMCRVYGADSVEAVVPVYNTATLDTAAAKYWQLAGEFEGRHSISWPAHHTPPHPLQALLCANPGAAGIWGVWQSTKQHLVVRNV